jgi:hypothetical protein
MRIAAKNRNSFNSLTLHNPRRDCTKLSVANPKKMREVEAVSDCNDKAYLKSFFVPDGGCHGDLFALTAKVTPKVLSASRSNDLSIDDSVNAYNERAFRYLLSIEQKRFERAGHPFALLLVDMKDAFGVGVAMPEEVATGTFTALAVGLRETDFTGWYRENEVAGAVLTACSRNTAELISGRLKDLLEEHVPGAITGRLQIRIVELPAQAHEVAGNRSELCQ